ncbi:MAG: diacylglycerol kinase family lipid kinase [Clostridia bacterium]|nr:diacylglycerol kinase family lipid kinase [Clostridia bacterium]
MHHIIVNPTAGKRKSKKSLEAVKRVFDEGGASYLIHETTRAGEAKEIAARLTAPALPLETAGEVALIDVGRVEEPVKLIIVGGDGTLHEVLNGISELSRCTLGLIPAGTGNDFAAAAGIPENAEKAARIILKNEAKPIDCLEVGGLRSMNVAGLGIDVDVLVRCSKGKLKGKIKYLISLIQSLFTFKGYEITVESGEKKETFNGLIAAACNGKKFGGGIKICPVAEIDDGLMDVIMVDCLGGVFSIIKAFTWLMRGKILEYPLARHFRCEQVSVRTKNPCAAQLDGEVYENLTFDAKICKGLTMYR